MISMNIRLKDIPDVRDFVDTVLHYDFEIDLISGRYVVDAKSIMGIFSLNLAAPIKLEARTDNPGDFEEKMKRFAV